MMMRQLLYRYFLIVCIITSVVSPIYPLSREALESPQYNMAGARLMSLGGTVSTISDDLNGVLI
ncbi:hypothetical protein DID77_00330, partial [Candidatus Marinamargulisbacteria bacterium SCGC AG-439-L15]